MKGTDYVLWLPSWYPNEYDRFNGDFIQRHARATSLFIPVNVIHFVQLGSAVPVKESKIDKTRSGHLNEDIVYFKFAPIGVSILDKLRFNYLFYQQARRYLSNYFRQFGLPRMVHVHVPMKAGNLALWIKKKYQIEYVASEQSSFYMERAHDSFYKKSFLHRMQIKAIFKRAIKVSNVSAAIGKVLMNLFEMKDVATIHNTVNTEVFNLGGEKSAKFSFIHVSTLTEQKNIYGILDAFSNVLIEQPDCTLKIVGPIKEELLQRINFLRLRDNVHLVGEVSYEQVAFLMKVSHALVMFSRHENFPCVIIEALCCGLPVVSSDVAGIKECVNSSNGVLVESENVTQLTEAMLTLLKNFSFYDAKEISKAASALYNYTSIGKQFYNLYLSIIDLKP